MRASGTVEAGKAFRVLALSVLAPPALRWRTLGWGLVVGDKLVSIIFWADNYRVFARTPDMLETMLREAHGALLQVCLGLKTSSLAHMTSNPH